MTTRNDDSDIDEEELRRVVRPAFDKFDAGKMGFISAKKLALAVKSLKLNVSAEQVHSMVQLADPGDTGDISFDEFVDAVRSQLQRSDDASVRSLLALVLHQNHI